MWKRLILLQACMMLFPLALSAQVRNAEQTSALAEEQDYAFAYGLFEDGLFQLASEQFDRFVAKYPSSMKRIDATFLGIEARFQQQQFDTAARLFRKFLSEYPDTRLSDDAYLRLGESYLRIKKHEEALEALKTVLNEFGESELAGEAAYWAGDAYGRMGDYENAVKYYTMAFEHYPGNRLRDYALYAVGWTYQTKGEYSKAIEWYDRLPSMFPESELVSASLVRRGECFFYTKEYRKAIQEINNSARAITRPEEQGEAAYLIAEAYYHLGEFEQARSHYDQFLEAYPDHRLSREVLYALGWTYLKTADYLRAASTFDRLVAGSDALAHSGLFRRGVAEKFGGKGDAALATWKDVVSKAAAGEFSDNALYESGLLLYEQKKSGEALPFFERVIKQYPSSDVFADSYRMAGECLLADSSYEKAKEYFARAIAVPNASFEARVNASYQLAWCQYKLARLPEAVQLFTQFLEVFSGHPKATDARFWRAEASYRLAHFQAAANDYLAVVGTNTVREEEARYGVAWSFFKLNDFGKAKDHFSALLSSFPNGKFVFDGRLRQADSFFFLKEYAGAEAAYRAVIRLFPDAPTVDYAYYQLGQTYYRNGNYNDAVRQFTELMKTFPKSDLADDAQYAMGWIWFQNKQYVEAIKEFQKLIQSRPESDLVPKATYSIGDAYYNQQEYAAAEKAYRNVLNQFPQSAYVADAITGIQYCLLAQGKKEEALRVIDTFVKENPKASAVESLLLKKGDLLYSQQQYDSAIREYMSFADKYPGSPHVAAAFYWTGKCYQAQNRLLDASQAFERAASVADGSPKIIAQSLLDLGETYLRLKSYEKSLNVLSRLEKSYSESEAAPDAMYLGGLALKESGKAAEAHQRFNALIGRFSKSTAADKGRIALARIYREETNFDEAIRFAEQVATSRTDVIGAEAQFLIGLTEASRGNWQGAITAFLRLRYIFPTQEEWLVQGYLGLGEAYEKTNEPRRAQEAYRSVLKFDRQREAVAEAQRRLKRMERS